MKNNVLQWKQINLVHKKEHKPILKDLQGEVRSGQLFTIMGPSGAGKSSLLSILTGRLTKRDSQFSLEGSITMNGHNYNAYQFGQFGAYVRQDDLLMGTLTVEETFDFQSQLKMANASEEEKKNETQKILKKLQLYECRKILVGNQFSKSISGGQKKRVAIGVQLLSNPSCLILDEPTSGLDSHIALSLIRILKNITQQGKIIITTIHQPSTLIFNEMQNLLLLSKGEIIYQGRAKEIVPYMEKIGVQINKRMNPADFFMLQIQQKWRAGQKATLMTSETFKKQKQKNLQNNQENNEHLPINLEAIASISNQMKQLMKRSFKNFYRTSSHQFGRLLGLLMMPFLLATLFNNIGNKFPQSQQQEDLVKYLNEFAAFMFMTAFFNFGINVYDAVLIFPSEKQLVLKETANGLYRLSVYLLCRCLVEMPLCIISSIFTGTIVYWVAALDNNPDSFVFFVGIFMLMGICGHFMGLFIGCLFTTSEYAIQILPLLVIPIVIFGGLVVNLETVPEYSSWIQYLSPIRHGYSLLMDRMLKTDKMHHIGEVDEIRVLVGVNGTEQVNMILLICQTFGLLLVCALLLKIKKKPV